MLITMNFIEPLEPRIAPAILVSPVDGKGVLLIKHDSAGNTAEHIVVTESLTTPGMFNVKDTIAVADFGDFSGVKSIVIQVTDLGDMIDLSFSQFGLAGSLDITATGGTNLIKLGTAAGAVSGHIAGKVNVQGGIGSDSVSVEGGLAISSPVTFHGGTGVDAFTPQGAYLAKKLTLESVETITVDNALPPVVIGGMLVENEDANAPVVFNLSQVTTITGKLTYCGSASVDDNVTLNGEFLGDVKLMLLDGINNVTTAGTYSGNVSITGGSGKDTVTFQSKSLNLGDPTKGPFINATVAGKLSMNLGNGTNEVTLQDVSYFAKDVSITTGTGTDTVNLTQFSAAKNVTLSLGSGANTVKGASSITQDFVGGKFKYVGGVDADDVDLDKLIAGSIEVKLGDGANTVTGDLRITGKSAKFTGGSGVDALLLSLASTGGSLSAKLGAGVDSFTFLGGALASASLDGGADADTLTGQALLPPGAKIVSFP